MQPQRAPTSPRRPESPNAPDALSRRAVPTRFYAVVIYQSELRGGDVSGQVTDRASHRRLPATTSDDRRRAAGPSQTIAPRYGGDNVIGCYRRGGINQLAAGGAGAAE